MSYSLFWRSPALPFVQKQNPISVPAGAVISNAASLRFTGKGATNYGKIQQENQMRLLENFAGDTEPPFATVGQTWYDTLTGVLKVCTATPPLSISPTADWRAINSTFVTGPGDPPPPNPEIGDQWFQQTGPASGQLYVYDSLGRYPLSDWDGHASTFFAPIATTTLAIIINSRTFAGAPGSNYNEAYIHGYTGITPADVPGSINTNSGVIAVPNGVMYTGMRNPRGHIVYDAGGSLISQGGASSFFSVRRVGYADDAWEYDNNFQWVPFTPTASMWVIGFIEVNAQDDNVAPGIVYAEVWTFAEVLSSSKNQAPVPLTFTATPTEGAIGGWSQVWPITEIAAGRDEYEEMHDTLMALVGSPFRFGGSDAVGKSVNYLTNMNLLDTSLWTRHYRETLPSADPLVTSPYDDHPAEMTPNSEDWSRMLAAIKYAINRLELPSGSVDNISDVPFVQDGRPLPEPLFSLAPTDVRYAGHKRGFNQRYGSVALARYYAETANMLEAAVQNRYMMKGILGTSGTNVSLPAGVVRTSQQRFTIPGTSLTGTLTHGLDFRFEAGGLSYPEKMLAFFYAAQAIDIVLVHTPSGLPTSQDMNFQSLLATSGRIRITADQLFIMTPAVTPALSDPPVAGGFDAVAYSSFTLHTLIGNGATIQIRAQRITGADNTFRIFLDITPGGALTGSFEARWGYIDDTELYNNPGPVRVYPAPIPYDPAHKQGSVLFGAVGT